MGGEQIYVGTNDGLIYGFNTYDGTQIGVAYDVYDPAYDYTGTTPGETAANGRRDHWSSYPLAAEGKVFASTDDGRIHVISGTTMMPLTGWLRMSKTTMAELVSRVCPTRDSMPPCR